MNPEQAQKDNLLKIAEAFSKASGKSLASISRKYHGTREFFDRFRTGECSVQLNTYWKIIRSINSEWPKGRAKPKALKDIPASAFLHGAEITSKDDIRERVR